MRALARQVRGARIVLWSEGRLLVQTDRRLSEDEQFFRLPGGHMEPGETPAACAAREAAEELDLALAVGPLLYVGWNEYRRKDAMVHELVFYLRAEPVGAIPVGDTVPTREPHLQACFRSPEELRAHRCLPAKLFARVLRDGPTGPDEVVYIEEP